jgi:plasmid stabilization system protein ParE
MTYTIQFSPQASDDLTDILGFYKEQSSPDLQKRFIQALSTTLKTLQNSPKSYSIRFKNIMRPLLWTKSC